MTGSKEDKVRRLIEVSCPTREMDLEVDFIFGILARLLTALEGRGILSAPEVREIIEK